MKKYIHPQYRPVIFRDASTGQSFLTNSTRTSPATMTWKDGKEYPVIDVETPSASRPLRAGRTVMLDAVGGVERFRRRYGRTGVLTA